MIISLTIEEIKKAKEFAQQIVATKKRLGKNNAYCIENNAIGRLGEIAFQKYLRYHGINVDLNYHIYDNEEVDSEDIRFRGWTMDVKCKRVGSSSEFWRLNYDSYLSRIKKGEVPHFYVITRMTDVFKYDSENESLNIEICGYIDSRCFECGTSDRGIDIVVGSDAHGRSVALYQVPMDKLCKDWDRFMKTIMDDRPFVVCGGRNDDIKSVQNNYGIKYSVLLSGKYETQHTVKDINKYLKQGIKVILFVRRKNISKYNELLNPYGVDETGAQLMFIYPVDDTAGLPDVIIKDGINAGAVLQQLENLSPSFNCDQYCVEHYCGDRTVIVKASAGTGKTFVMLDRIMYLMAVECVTPREICMLTFTNDATDSMRNKLSKKLDGLFNLTGQIKYLHYMEEVPAMQISTIDSFFKTMIQQFAFDLGFGTGLDIRGLSFEKSRIIRDVVDEIFRENIGSEGYFSKFILTNTNYISLVEACWNKLNQRGFYYKEIKDLNFGSTDDEKSEVINSYLKMLVLKSAERYQALKKKMNAIAVNDIGGEMLRLSQISDAEYSGQSIKYLFIDEFQDTDNGQIACVNWLKEKTGCKLLVVGDIKQCIYRFRGAEATSFNLLQEYLGGSDYVQNFSLKKNYRTDEKILDKLNVIFRNLGDRNPSPLLWEDDAVTGYPDKIHTGIMQNISYGKDNFEGKVLEALEKTIPGEIGILVRTNDDVNAIAEICEDFRKTHDGYVVLAKRDGGFYTSAPVTDILALLGAVLYPADNRRLFNVLMSNYSSVRPDMTILRSLAGKEKEINCYFNKLLVENAWKEILRDARMMPCFTFIRKAISKLNPVMNYYYSRKDAPDDYVKMSQAGIDTSIYELNLDKLIQILYNSFKGEAVSIDLVYNFLLLNRQTNSSEDMVYVDEKSMNKSNLIIVSTVHKSKGLEYANVIGIFYDRGMTYLPKEREQAGFYSSFIPYEEDGINKIGWYYVDRYAGMLKNNNFESVWENEKLDLIGEEARLLYVMLTRVKSRLICVKPKYAREDTWATLMETGRRK